MKKITDYITTFIWKKGINDFNILIRKKTTPSIKLIKRNCKIRVWQGWDIKCLKSGRWHRFLEKRFLFFITLTNEDNRWSFHDVNNLVTVQVFVQEAKVLFANRKGIPFAFAEWYCNVSSGKSSKGPLLWVK